MGKMIIADVPGANGEYEADLTYFTNREVHEIKKQTGLRAGELQEAFEAGDNDTIVAFALVVFNRLGKPMLGELIWEAKAGCITFDFSDEEAATEDPPAETLTGSVAAENGNADRHGSSGVSSKTLSALPANDPSPTGSPGSDTGGTSAPATLAI